MKVVGNFCLKVLWLHDCHTRAIVWCHDNHSKIINYFFVRTILWSFYDLHAGFDPGIENIYSMKQRVLSTHLAQKL